MFLYELAYELKLPVYVILEEMPYSELRNWMVFFERRPAGWREDNRTAMILQAFGVKEKPEKLFKSIELIKKHSVERESPSTLKSKLAALLARSSEKSPWSDVDS